MEILNRLLHQMPRDNAELSIKNITKSCTKPTLV